MNTYELRILQSNLRKSREHTDSVLNHPDTESYALLALQEQYISLWDNKPLQHQSWTLVEPTIITENPSYAVIYINKKIIDSNSFTQWPIPIPDTVAVEITTTAHKPSLIINIYRPPEEDTITQLQLYLHTAAGTSKYDKILLLGDFNVHHPLWNPISYTKHDPLSDTLVQIAMEQQLSLLIAPGTITFPCNNEAGGTTID